MTMEKILTIVIPTYNMEKYLDKCLSSLIVSDENMKRLEVLVINDGSKDRSSEIAHLYESRFPQTFRVIDKENGNYGSCVNRGLKEATGKYIKMLDADDTFYTEAFNQFIIFLCKIDVDLIVSDYCQIDEYGIINKKEILNLPTNKIFSLNVFSLKQIRNLCHQSITYKTENLRKIHYLQTEGISYTDNEWMFSPMTTATNICYFPYFIYSYLRGREGQTFDLHVFERNLWMRIAVVKSMLKTFQDIIINCNETSLHYLKERIISRCNSIYYSYLVRFPHSDLKELIDFDLYIKSISPNIYEETNKIQNRIHLHYIAMWRKHNVYIKPILFLMRLKYRVIGVKL